MKIRDKVEKELSTCTQRTRRRLHKTGAPRNQDGEDTARVTEPVDKVRTFNKNENTSSTF